MNSKQSRLIFVDSVKEIAEENGMVKISPDYKGQTKYQKRTGKNCLTICIRPEQDHEICFTVTGFLETPSPNNGNPYSGKVNFHAAYSDVLTAVADFEDHLKEIIEKEL